MRSFSSISAGCCSKLNGIVRKTFELSSTEHTAKRTLFSFKQNGSTVIALQYSQHARSSAETTSFLHLGHSSFCRNVCKSIPIIFQTIFCRLSRFWFCKSVCSISVRSIIAIPFFSKALLLNTYLKTDF